MTLQAAHYPDNGAFALQHKVRRAWTVTILTRRHELWNARYLE